MQAQAESGSTRYKDSLRASSDLKSPVTYAADDSILFDVKSGKLYLYRTATLNYDNIALQAGEIELEVDSQTLHARPMADSAGKETQLPQFKQGEETYGARTLSYNFKTQKGRITDGRMMQGEAYILAETAKYQPDGSFHGKEGHFTTCDDPDPHFYIRSSKMKVLPDSRLISGPLNFVIADFPIPVIIPFAFVPNQKGKSSGLQMPQYGEAQDRGFFLRNLGYYFNINDYLDLTLSGDIYTRGGWRLGGTTNYRKKYAFNGSLGFQYGVQRFNEKTDPDFRRTSAWSLNWNHSQPIDPTARISASVNISSSNSFQRQISYNATDFFTNNLNSSVSFQKNFNNLPFNINASVRHQQDLNKETMTMQLPEFSFAMNRQTPFRNIDNRYLTWLKQLGVSYNMQARNTMETITDSIFLPVLLRPRDSVDYLQVINGDSSLIRRTGGSFYKNGLQHSASASTTVKLLNYINISPSFQYNEFWYLETLRKEWNPETRKITESEVPGFERAYDFRGSLSATTNFYGIYQLYKTKRQVTFRQRFTSSLSYNIKPDFSDSKWGFYQDVQVDTTGKTVKYSIFEDGIYGGPTLGESQAIGFSLGSVLEMKYRKKESFAEDFDPKQEKFIRTNVIDNLSLNTSYNFAADSFQLTPVSLAARTSLFDRKLNININGTVDPYVFDYVEVPSPYKQPAARRLNQFMLTEEGKLGRLTNFNITMTTTLKPGKNGKAELVKNPNFDEEEYRYTQESPQRYVDFSIPWSANLNYSFRYSKPGLDAARINQTLNIDGDVAFTDKWKIGVQSGYDFKNLKFTQTRMSVFRDLHCWQMSFQWVPFGAQKSYSVVISARSSTLSMLRLSKNDFWQDKFSNF
ncbi:MAG: LPS-assembly protein LptD [Bacteroidetes bacterium]|nr:MAG: LPS-assembly protein LptD [Bacteroidota bacterium]